MAIKSLKSGSYGRSVMAGNSLILPGDYESIATQTVGAGGVASVTFSSIPSTFTHLQIRAFARSATAAQTDGLRVRFNGDTASNYARHVLYGDGTSALAAAAASGNLIGLTDITAASATANAFGVAISDILDYANTNKYKVTRTLGGGDTNSASFGQVDLFSGLWMSTTAINSINIFMNSGANITQYSHFALYGIRG